MPRIKNDTHNMWRQTLKQNIGKFRIVSGMLLAIMRMAVVEFKRGRLTKHVRSFIKNQAYDISWADLLEECAADAPNKVFLHYEEEEFSYKRMDQNANRVAHFLSEFGDVKGKGLGIFMRNSPRFLDLFFASQKLGMYSVPINPELKGDGLAYIVNHSDIDVLIIDAESITAVMPVITQFTRVKTGSIIINDIDGEAADIPIGQPMRRLSEAYHMPCERPNITIDPAAICLILYTSGTTGPPKGVVYRYNTTTVNKLRLLGYFLLKEKDVYYTYLALCHGNALFLSTTVSMGVRATVALSRRFSASRFWDRVRRYDATIFNTIGSIIPILMKQPEKETDSLNKVRIVFSAACPMDMWEAFENRFGVVLYEGYGAIDGGGKGIINLGTAPAGSLGKPPLSGKVKIVDEEGRDVPPGVPGELLFYNSKRSGRVEYYKNDAASDKKTKDGWLYTGDIIKKDTHGFFYFVGRNTESMRKGGENISAYEVEHVIMKHPAVEDVAVYAVPSEMIEDEIMAAVKRVRGMTLTPEVLRDFLKDKLAKFAIPRYIRFVDEFPKTNTHRIIKRELEEQGITKDTYDAMRK